MNRLPAAIFLLLLLVQVSRSSAQDTLRFSYTQSDELTTIADSMAYTRLAWKEGKRWQVRDYRYPGGELRMQGTYTEEHLQTRSGDFIYYYSDGRKLEEGRYANDKKEGPWRGWFADGLTDYENNYLNGEYQGRNR